MTSCLRFEVAFDKKKNILVSQDTREGEESVIEIRRSVTVILEEVGTNQSFLEIL